MSRSSKYWILSTSTVHHDDQAERVHFNPNLESLRDGQTVGCLVTETGELHYFVDGKDQGVGWNGLPVDKPLWGFADIYGRTTKIRLLGELQCVVVSLLVKLGSGYTHDANITKYEMVHVNQLWSIL